MLDTFIGDLKASRYYTRIFHNREIIMLFVAGSRLINIVDERSDYDLVAFTNESERIEHNDEFLTYKGKKVHWHYVPLTKLISNENGNKMSCYGEVLLSYLDDSKIIYENSGYSNAIDYLKENKNRVAQVGIYKLVKLHDKLINTILQHNEIRRENYCKFIYHLCFASYIVENKTPEPGFLSAVKRIRWQPIAFEYKNKAVERISLLYNYVLNNPLNLQDIINSFNCDIQSLIR